MPEIVLCHKCKYVLYEGNDLLPPVEIIMRYARDGKCPQCGRKLGFTPLDVTVDPDSTQTRKVPYKQPVKKKIPYKQPVKKETTSPIEHDFLSSFYSRFSRITERFSLYPVSREVWRTGGRSSVKKREVISMHLPMDQYGYFGCKRAIRCSNRKGKIICEYVEKKFVSSPWIVVDPSNVPLSVRIEYEQTLSKKLDEIEELLEREDKNRKA